MYLYIKLVFLILDGGMEGSFSLSIHPLNRLNQNFCVNYNVVFNREGYQSV